MMLTNKESLLQQRNPIIVSFQPGLNSSLKMGIAQDGNCYSSSWMTVALLWSAEERERLLWLEEELKSGHRPGGAFSSVPRDYMV